MSLSLLLVLIVLGAVTGVTAGMFGIGGGILLVPALTLVFDAYGLAHPYGVHMAIATSLAIIFCTSLVSVYAHHARGAVRWPIVLALTPGLLVGSWIGPGIASELSAAALSTVFAIFVFASALRMWFNAAAPASRELPEWPLMSLVGALIGTVSGIVGGGGGFLSVPYMTWCNVAMHNAIATSAALVFPIALIGTFSNVYHGWSLAGLPEHSLGLVYLPALVTVALASILGAPVGVRVAHSLSALRLTRLFALLLLGLGSFMFWKALHG